MSKINFNSLSKEDLKHSTTKKIKILKILQITQASIKILIIQDVIAIYLEISRHTNLKNEIVYAKDYKLDNYMRLQGEIRHVRLSKQLQKEEEQQTTKDDPFIFSEDQKIIYQTQKDFLRNSDIPQAMSRKYTTGGSQRILQKKETYKIKKPKNIFIEDKKRNIYEKQRNIQSSHTCKTQSKQYRPYSTITSSKGVMSDVHNNTQPHDLKQQSNRYVEYMIKKLNNCSLASLDLIDRTPKKINKDILKITKIDNYEEKLRLMSAKAEYRENLQNKKQNMQTQRIFPNENLKKKKLPKERRMTYNELSDFSLNLDVNRDDHDFYQYVKHNA